jgi:hypothetical protein
MKKEVIKMKINLKLRIVLVFMSFFYIFIKGIKNITQIEIINRIKQANKVSDIFKNYYGTCAINTMLFLNTINLETFEKLSINIIKNKAGLVRDEISLYLNLELNINSIWFSFSVNGENDSESITLYIEKIRNRLIKMRSFYGFAHNQSILTAMNYPKKKKDVGHSVVIWLTNNNEIIIIDPQKFFINGIILYTSEALYERYMNNDKLLKIEPIRAYIRENIDILSNYRDTELYESLHIEIHDKNSLEPKNIINTISRIKKVEDIYTFLIKTPI